MGGSFEAGGLRVPMLSVTATEKGRLTSFVICISNSDGGKASGLAYVPRGVLVFIKHAMATCLL